jgi:hypothetical protein
MTDQQSKSAVLAKRITQRCKFMTADRANVPAKYSVIADCDPGHKFRSTFFGSARAGYDPYTGMQVETVKNPLLP